MLKPDNELISVLARFVDKIQIHQETKCWEWTGALNNQGYGQIHFQGKTVLAHRLSAWALAGFDLDESLCLCHRCDNPRCINPHHLFEGTQSDNLADMLRKGRHRANTKKAAEARRKPIGCSNGKTYATAYQAAAELDLWQAQIQQVAAGRRKTVHGLKFWYLEQINELHDSNKAAQSASPSNDSDNT